jgi:hypothetical protein
MASAFQQLTTITSSTDEDDTTNYFTFGGISRTSASNLTISGLQMQAFAKISTDYCQYVGLIQAYSTGNLTLVQACVDSALIQPASKNLKYGGLIGRGNMNANLTSIRFQVNSTNG